MKRCRAKFILVIPAAFRSRHRHGGGFKLYVEDRAGRGPRALEQAVGGILGPANQTPGLVQVFTLFNTSTPQVYADIDRTKAEMLGVPITRFFDTLSTYMGSTFVNDFNILGRHDCTPCAGPESVPAFSKGCQKTCALVRFPATWSRSEPSRDFR